MRPNKNQLAMRDPALATLMGAIGGDDFGSPFGAEFGVDFGDEDFGDDMSGDDYGVDFGAAAPAPAARPSPGELMKAWRSHHAKRAHSHRRASLLEPNKGSAIKVERYAFTINQTVTLGTAVALTMSGQPDTNIRPQRVTMNAPSPGFATISEIKVANVSVTVGGVQDAYDYASVGVDSALDMPTLSPANKATVLGGYTGYVPPGFVGGSSYLFCASFKGPASVIA